MSELPLPARVATAKALLDESPERDYRELPATQRAQFEEAIEFLRRVETDIHGDDG